MSPFTPRELLDLAARQEVEGVDLVARILSLTPSPSSSGRGGQNPHPQPLSHKERGEALTPEPSSTGRGGITQTLRARPAWLVLILVLMLALISGAAYALGRSLGYLPGVGLVEQGTPIRVLAEPLSQTRDGITLTVQEAVLTSDRTVIVMTLENIPSQAFARPEDSSACYWEPQLRLPRKTLPVIAGRGSGDAQGRLELRWSYAPIPPHVNEVEFFVPCIQGALPGQAPENWVFKLRFVPAPPDLTILPVQEVPTPVPGTASAPSIPPEGWRVEKVIETAEEYILVGTFRLSDLPYNAVALGFSDWIRVTDALGNEVPARAPEDIDLSSPMAGVIAWSLEIQGKGHAWPLTLSASSIDAETFDLSAEFTFDAGENPMPGQEWTLNQMFQLDEWEIEVLRARFTGKGYEFDLRAPDPVKHVGLEIVGTNPSGGFGSSDDQGNIQVGFEYQNPPVGQMTVKVTSVIFRVQGDWKVQWMPEDDQSSQNLYGIRLVLDKTVELEDGYYLVGHLEWDDERIELAVPGAWLFATDAKGNRLALDEVSFDVFSQLVPNFSELPYQPWVYRLAGKSFQPPITLHLEKINLAIDPPIPLTIDLTSQGFAFDEAHAGLSYNVAIPLEGLPEMTARLVTVSYLRQKTQQGFDLYFEADPRLSGLYFHLAQGSVSETGEGVSSMGAYRDALSGFLVARLLTDAQLTMPLTLTAPSLQIQGDWTVEWTPPPALPSSTPVFAEQACLTLEQWKQALVHPPMLPTEIPSEIILQRDVVAPNPSLFLVKLSNLEETLLVNAQWGSLSPDGQKLVYADPNNQLRILDLATRETTPLTQNNQDFTPFWSPSGEQIAFVRLTEQGQNLFFIAPDGSNLRQLSDWTGTLTLSGWTPDGRQVLFTKGATIQAIDVQSGIVSTLYTTRLRDTYTTVSVSPQGWIAFIDDALGWMAPGLYLAKLDGSEKRLLVQLDDRYVADPFFSPDGKWLAFSVTNSDLPKTPFIPALINIETCQVVPLPAFRGVIRGWKR